MSKVLFVQTRTDSCKNNVTLRKHHYVTFILRLTFWACEQVTASRSCWHGCRFILLLWNYYVVSLFLHCVLPGSWPDCGRQQRLSPGGGAGPSACTSTEEDVVKTLLRHWQCVRSSPRRSVRQRSLFSQRLSCTVPLPPGPSPSAGLD